MSVLVVVVSNTVVSGSVSIGSGSSHLRVHLEADVM